MTHLHLHLHLHLQVLEHVEGVPGGPGVHGARHEVEGGGHSRDELSVQNLATPNFGVVSAARKLTVSQ